MVSLKHQSISAVLSLFFSLFPANLKKTLENNPQYFYLSNFTASKRMHCRILLLTAIGYFLREEEANYPKFCDYIDSLFVVLLEPESTSCFQKIVLEVLNKNFPADKRNRHRIEQKYFSTVDFLYAHVTEKLKELAAQAALEEEPVQTKGANKEEQTAKGPKPKSSLLEVIYDQIDAFYSRWSNNDAKVVTNARLNVEVFPYQHLFYQFEFTPAEVIVQKSM